MKTTEIKLLDHGYLKLVESWGSDERIVEAARMSTDKGFLGWGPRRIEGPCGFCGGQGIVDDRSFPLRGQVYFTTKSCPVCGGDKLGRVPGDEKLLRYLYEHKHATPFEFAGLVVEVQAPIFVFREWHRHRTQSYNELSARYTPLPVNDYVPTSERCLLVAGTNRQASAQTGAAELTHAGVIEWLEELEGAYAHSERVYQSGLRRGIPKELARLSVPVARYSRMRAHACLRNWLGFMTLRSEKNPDAQWEIRQYANALGLLLAEAFPRTWELFQS